jgi:type II secretory pathway component GspD/PulD (secretin)
MKRRGFFIVLMFSAFLVHAEPVPVATLPLPPPAPVNASPPTPGFLLNFQNADIDAVLRFFSEMTGQVFIKSEAVRGFITVTAPGSVTQAEALDILRVVLDLRGFALVPGPGKMMKVLTTAEAIQSGVEVASSETILEGGERLITIVHALSFISATDLKNHLSPLLSRGGNLIADERMNRIVMTDMSSNIRRLMKIIQGLDVRSPQVLIEALMVEVSLTKETKLGIEWSRAGEFTADGHSFNDNISQSYGVPGFIGEGLKYAVIRSDEKLKGLLHALATDKNVNILSTPHILTMNNQPAVIRVGEEVPVLTQTRNIQGGETIQSYDFKQVAIELEVTPRINPGREVLLKVHPLVKKILGFNSELNAPILATREAQTTVQVSDGHTVVIGGLIKDDRSSNQSKIPILGDIPLLGYFFKRRGATSEKTELLVFITPRVVENPDEAERVTVRKESESRAKTMPHRRSAREALRQGKLFYDEGRFSEASDAFEEALRTTPEKKLRRTAMKWLRKSNRKAEKALNSSGEVSESPE